MKIVSSIVFLFLFIGNLFADELQRMEILSMEKSIGNGTLCLVSIDKTNVYVILTQIPPKTIRFVGERKAINKAVAREGKNLSAVNRSNVSAYIKTNSELAVVYAAKLGETNSTYNVYRCFHNYLLQRSNPDKIPGKVGVK